MIFILSIRTWKKYLKPFRRLDRIRRSRLQPLLVRISKNKLHQVKKVAVVELVRVQPRKGKI
jgi:hypothetical protein